MENKDFQRQYNKWKGRPLDKRYKKWFDINYQVFKDFTHDIQDSKTIYDVIQAYLFYYQGVSINNITTLANIMKPYFDYYSAVKYSNFNDE